MQRPLVIIVAIASEFVALLVDESGVKITYAVPLVRLAFNDHLKRRNPHIPLTEVFGTGVRS